MRPTPEQIATALSLPFDRAQMRRIVSDLAELGSAPSGFRVTGTPEDRAAARLAAAEMRAIGLRDVSVETVPVDGWRMRSASIDVGGRSFECASMGGVPGTPPGGIAAPLVWAGDASRRRLDRIDVGGRIAVVEWRSGSIWPSDVGLELAARGAIGVVVHCPQGGPYYQSPRALGAFNSRWYAGAPPMVTIRKEDAARVRKLMDGGHVEAKLTLRVEAGPSQGANAVGYLPGRRRGAPIVVGAHHDGWFRAAFDNASGVAVMLGMARAMMEAGVRPERTICFTSRTAEEFGQADSEYDWCTGAHGQIAHSHPEWGARSPFHLCVEASGHTGLPLLVEAPPELTGWARSCLRAADREGLLTSGWKMYPPGCGTELWPLLVAGVPGVSVLTWGKSFSRSAYHSPLDTIKLVDFGHLERLGRAYSLMVLDADRRGDDLCDHRARARHLEQAVARSPVPLPGLRAAARRHAAASGRRAFTAVGRGLLALDANDSSAYPFQQAARDLTALKAAQAALAKGDKRTAARHAARVGDNALCGALSHDTMRRRLARLERDRAGDGWGGRSHLTESPNLWLELASLRGEPGAPPADWVKRSLRGHAEDVKATLERAAARMEAALARAGGG